MTDITYIMWQPVTRSDISWNFEKVENSQKIINSFINFLSKFLIDKNGETVKRFGPGDQPKVIRIW